MFVDIKGDLLEFCLRRSEDGTEDEDLSRYARMEKLHDARQPFIEEELIEAIKKYNCVSYRQLALHINDWCQHTCIAK